MLLIHVRGVAPEALGPAALRLTDQTIDADAAVAPSFRGLAALSQAGGTTILTGAAEYLALTDRLVQATGSEVVAALADDVSDTYGWFVFGDARRELVQQEGAVASDQGSPTAEESGADLDEDVVLDLLERRTGAALDWEATATLLAPA